MSTVYAGDCATVAIFREKLTLTLAECREADYMEVAHERSRNFL